ncbi:MAG: tRNA (uridine(34)/cytosine(34)/5-carboxymethylaminomethyluridine(34)-2'-O)-methyltransferase TrmL [Proteobacteria bacterium]|nr:tRNA (uridine(34)/cytosine(34)/5-carboxymethylaminomethyluridine(34)-2'-O)-methyltransferase TrmL [Pseudomonadota bacterium]
MLKIVLHQPEIPPNTGNIIRLCANTGCSLHLIEPLGFDLDDKRMRRAGLDYREFASVAVYPDFNDFCQKNDQSRLLCITTKGAQPYHQVNYQANDAIIFGSETRGLPAKILDAMPAGQKIRIPMKPNSRSLNLSNAAAIVAYEALRQMGFTELT